MSLAQHVSSIEGEDRLPDDEPTDQTLLLPSNKSVRRVLSYDAFPLTSEVQPNSNNNNVAAYKISELQRGVQVCIIVLACWLASGIVFGFAALKPILISEGVYRDLCTDDELGEGVTVCIEQNVRLNFFFTVASITANVSALPVGAVLDRHGPRICGILGSIVLAAGSLLIANDASYPGFDGYVLGNILLALGGTFIFVPSFHVSNAFPKYAGTIVAVITGSFDASAAVFLFYRLAYEATSHRFGTDKFFSYYVIVPLFILLAEIFILPQNSYQTMPQLEEKIEKAQDSTRDVHDSDDEIDSPTELEQVWSRRKDRRENRLQKLSELLGDEEERQQKVEKEEERHVASGVWGVLHGQQAHEQMMTWWFVLITLLTVLQMLRMNYFIATIRSQYEYVLGSKSQAEKVNDFFDIALPVGGVLCTPFIGIILDNFSVPMTLALIVCLTTIVGVLNSLPYIWAAYATISLFVILRPLYYSAMSDYAVKVFGFATFGRVYGTIICLSGLTNFSQYVLDALTLDTFHGNPTPINISLTSVGFVIGVVLVMYVWLRERALNASEALKRAEGDRISLIVEEDEEDLD